MESLQPRAETNQDLFCGIAIRLVDAQPMESSHQCAIFFEALVVLFPGSRCHDLEIALGDGWFDHVGEIHGAVAR